MERMSKTIEISVYDLQELRDENRNLKEEVKKWKMVADENGTHYDMLEEENKTLSEKVRFLEECLDRKEKLNKKYRKEIEKLKSTYVYDAKQVRDIC